MIYAQCPHCGQQVSLGDDFAGRASLCPHCSGQFIAPAAAPPLPPPAGVRVGSMSPQKTSGQAIASFVLGLLAFFCLGPFCAIPGIILGHLGLSNIRRDPARLEGQGLAIAGLVLSYVSLVLWLLILPAIMLPALARAREAARRASCGNNLKQMGIVYKMFANESKGGLYPPLSSEAGKLMFENEAPEINSSAVYPEYLADTHVMLCPSQESPTETTNSAADIDDQNYFYLGYVVRSPEELRAFAEAYKEHVRQGLPFNSALEVAPGQGNAGGDKILRLQEGVERFLVTDSGNPASVAAVQSETPILWERCQHQNSGRLLYPHIRSGMNVLFMDGHVEFKRAGEWPVTDEVMRTLLELDAL